MKIFNLGTVVTVFTVAAAVYAMRTGRPTGRLLSVPYDFRMPSIDRVRDRLWNEDDDRIFTPTVFGAGWSLNLFQLVRKFQADNAVEEPEITKEICGVPLLKAGGVGRRQ